MKKKILLIILLAIMIITPIGVYADSNTEYVPTVTLEYDQSAQSMPDNIPDVGSKAVYIANPVTGKVIYEKNAHEKMYPASTTKILTALVTMENCEMTDTAVVSQTALDLVPEGYSNANLQVGEEHTIEDLLYALLLPSANEAANVLAEHVSGSVEDFAELCNKRAKELGCENLHFVNANGMHDENHYCSAYDLYLIAKECQKYEVFNEIVRTKTYTIPATEIYPEERTIKNTNELLFPGTYYYSNCTGIKTGHTTPAGECLVASSSFDNIDLICVVLGGELVNSKGLNDRFYDSKSLFEYTYENYSVKTLAEKGDIVATLDVGRATDETRKLEVVVDTDISTIVPNDINKENVAATISLLDNIKAPIEENQVLGQITIHADGLNYTTNIVASHEVVPIKLILYAIFCFSCIVLAFIIFGTAAVMAGRFRKFVVAIEIIALIGAGIIVYPYIQNIMDDSVKITSLAPNVTMDQTQ